MAAAKRRTKKTRKAKRTKKRESLVLKLILWDDAHMAVRQDDPSSFKSGLKVLTAGINVTSDDPADKDLPDMGTVIFSNAAGELLEVDTGSAAGREAFREDWQQRREELQQLSYRLGVGLIPISTNEDVHRSLISGLRHFAARK